MGHFDLVQGLGSKASATHPYPSFPSVPRYHPPPPLPPPSLKVTTFLKKKVMSWSYLLHRINKPDHVKLFNFLPACIDDYTSVNVFRNPLEPCIQFNLINSHVAVGICYIFETRVDFGIVSGYDYVLNKRIFNLSSPELNLTNILKYV